MSLAEKVCKLDLYFLHQNNCIESFYQLRKFHSDLFIVKVTKGQRSCDPHIDGKLGVLAFLSLLAS